MTAALTRDDGSRKRSHQRSNSIPSSARMDRSQGTTPDSSVPSTSSEEVFEVERILEKKVQRGKTFYKIKWMGYSLSEATWEPKDNVMEGCAALVQEFERTWSERGDKMGAGANKHAAVAPSSNHSASVSTRKPMPRGSKSPEKPAAKRARVLASSDEDEPLSKTVAKVRRQQQQPELAAILETLNDSEMELNPGEKSVKVGGKRTLPEGRMQYQLVTSSGKARWVDIGKLDEVELELVERFEHGSMSDFSSASDTEMGPMRSISGSVEQTRMYDDDVEQEHDLEFGLPPSRELLVVAKKPEVKLLEHHCRKCVECGRGPSKSSPLLPCATCSITVHLPCMPLNCKKLYDKSGSTSDPGSRQFLCGSCIKAIPECADCSHPQVDSAQQLASITTETAFIRCLRCLRAFHPQCLETARSRLEQIVSQNPRHRVLALTEDTVIDDDLFKFSVMEHPFCWDCRTFTPDPEKLLACRFLPEHADAMAAVAGDEDGESQIQGLVAQHPATVQYLVKFKTCSYRWMRWVPGHWLRSVSQLANTFIHSAEAMQQTEQDYVHLTEIDRILTSDIDTNDGTCSAYIKWKGLAYEDATWEIWRPTDGDRYSELVNAVKQWDAMEKLNSREAQRKREKMDSPIRFQELKTQPEFVTAGTLLNYQLDGVNWLLYKWSQGIPCVLADEMGLGKYITLKHGLYPHLVIVPNTTLTNWQRELETWASTLQFVIYHGTEKSREILASHDMFVESGSGSKIARERYLKRHIVLTTYEMIIRDASLLSRIAWETVVIDEGHRLKDRNSKFYQKLCSIQNVQWKLLLTGTPLQNNMKECLNLMYYLDPIKFGNLPELEERYEELDKEKIAEIHDLLRQHILRRTKQVLGDLIPDKVELIVPVTMSPLQRDLYRKILTKNFTFLRGGAVSKFARKTSLTNVLMELRKLLNHPFLVQGGQPAMNADTITVEMQQRALIEASGKLYLLHHLLKRLKARGSRVLIFSTMTRVLDILEDYMFREGIKYSRLDGSMNRQEKQREVDAFSATESDSFVFLLSTRAGGLGINLTAADTVILYDADYNPHADLQALARAHRLGQKKRVLVLRFMVQGSVEDRIMQIAKRKLVMDHLVIEKMDSEQPMDATEVDDILKYGAEAIFEEKHGGSEGETAEEIGELMSGKMPVLEDSYLDKLLDLDQVSTYISEASRNSNDPFSFVKLWQTEESSAAQKEEDHGQDGTGEKGSPMEEDAQGDFWARLLEERWKKEQELQAEEDASQYGRVDGKSVRTTKLQRPVDYTHEKSDLLTSSSPLRASKNMSRDLAVNGAMEENFGDVCLDLSDLPEGKQASVLQEEEEDAYVPSVFGTSASESEEEKEEKEEEKGNASNLPDVDPPALRPSSSERAPSAMVEALRQQSTPPPPQPQPIPPASVAPVAADLQPWYAGLEPYGAMVSIQCRRCFMMAFVETLPEWKSLHNGVVLCPSCVQLVRRAVQQQQPVEINP